MEKYIAYYRVSTKEQGDSGLGLQAQETSVLNYIKDQSLIISTYREVESGKNPARPELLKAIEECKKTGATLIIAKLDRLSRNAGFIFTLKDSNIRFTCADMPEANSLTIGLMAVLAEEEAKRISDRTKSALSEIKRNIAENGFHTSKNGRKITSLGNPSVDGRKSLKKAREVLKEKSMCNVESIKSAGMIIEMRENGKSFSEITKRLNDLGFKAPKGGKLSRVQVKRLYEKFK